MYKNKSREVSLILCPFSRIIVGNFLRPLTYLSIVIDSAMVTIYGFYLVRWDLIPIRKWLITHMIFILPRGRFYIITM